MTIYAYYEGKIYQAEVIETKKRYILIGEPVPAFGYGKRFVKENCSLSPKEAFDKEINNYISKISDLKKKIQELNLKLGRVLQDKADYENTLS